MTQNFFSKISELLLILNIYFKQIYYYWLCQNVFWEQNQEVSIN